jgi:hypothetical protein
MIFDFSFPLRKRGIKGDFYTKYKGEKPALVTTLVSLFG